jgi:hypothetical protein
MTTDRNIQLRRIINDGASTAEEIAEAKRQLEDMPLTEDKIIERYLDSEIDRDEWANLGPETRSFCLCLPRPSALGDIVDTREEALARLIDLYRHTGSVRVRATAVDGVRAVLRHVSNQLTPENRAKRDAFMDEPGYDQQLIRKLFIEAGSWPAVERVARNAANFLESLSV